MSVLWLGSVAFVGLGGWKVIRRKLQPTSNKLYPNTFNRLLARWTSVHGAPSNLLPPYTEKAYAPLKLPEESDVSDYSFDRAVVTDNAEIAAMLVANNFHFENNCAVLSVDGFPGPQAETIMTMLRRNPNLTVVAVHDASKSGVQLAQTLRKSHWFPDRSVKIIDAGLLPRHAQTLRAPVVRDATVPARKWTLDARLAANDVQQPCAVDSATDHLQPAERAWLDRGGVIELAAVRPARLMQALFNAFALAQTFEECEDHAWIYDYRDYDAADHFG